MFKLLKLLLPLFLISMFFACGNQPVITEPGTPTSTGAISDDGFQGELTAAITLDSAIFSIYVDGVTNQTITAHNITADWLENVVTWNSFAGAFDPASLGSYVSNGIGFHRVNITSLAQAWLNGTTPNYGILLKQAVGGLTPHLSSEAPIVATHPMLQLYYDSQVVTIQRGTFGTVYDTYIRENLPTTNFGAEVYIYTGFVSIYEKQILVKFELPVDEQDGCTRTIGYWKTHAGFGPQPDMVTQYLPIWLGTPGGAKSLNVSTALIAYNVLGQNVYGTPSNGITKLYAQLLGAKLNGENGADLTDVAAVIAAADIFLATNNHLDWAGLSQADKNMVLGWHDMLDDYNNGYIGPGHCEEDSVE